MWLTPNHRAIVSCRNGWPPSRCPRRINVRITSAITSGPEGRLPRSAVAMEARLIAKSYMILAGMSPKQSPVDSFTAREEFSAKLNSWSTRPYLLILFANSATADAARADRSLLRPKWDERYHI